MTKDDFKDLVAHNGEIEFLYNNVSYGLESYSGGCMLFVNFKNDTTVKFKNHESLFDYKINGKKIIDACEEFEIKCVS